jgi:hypothetical protein
MNNLLSATHEIILINCIRQLSAEPYICYTKLSESERVITDLSDHLLTVLR